MDVLGKLCGGLLLLKIKSLAHLFHKDYCCLCLCFKQLECNVIWNITILCSILVECEVCESDCLTKEFSSAKSKAIPRKSSWSSMVLLFHSLSLCVSGCAPPGLIPSWQ